MYVFIYVCTHTHIQKRTHANAHTPHAHTRTYTHAQTHTYAHTYVHTYTYHTHPPTHTLAHTHTPTHTPRTHTWRMRVYTRRRTKTNEEENIRTNTEAEWVCGVVGVVMMIVWLSVVCEALFWPYAELMWCVLWIVGCDALRCALLSGITVIYSCT